MGQYFNVYLKDNKGKEFAFIPSPAKLMEHSWWTNSTVNRIVLLLFESPKEIAWIGDYADTENDVPDYIYEFTHSAETAVTIEQFPYPATMDHLFLVNHTKKIYVDCRTYHNENLKINIAKTNDPDMVIHPLPLLTAVGNGEGGGDYFGINQQYVGTWAFDTVSVECKPPEGYSIVFYLFSE